MRYYQCRNCATIHYGVSREWANAQIYKHKRFHKTLVKEKRDMYVGGELDVMHQFETCHRCGNDYRLFCDLVEPMASESILVYPIIFNYE